MHLIRINHRMQAYVPVVVAAAAARGVVEAVEAVGVVGAVEVEAFRRIDKNPTYFYDRIMGIVTEMVVIPLHHLFRMS